jgi:hypothetical protein
MRGLIVGALAALAPGLAAAQVYVGPSVYSEGESGAGSGRSESPQSWALEAKFSPYLPPIDQEFGEGGATPFGDIFGNSPSVMGRLELSYQALRLGDVLSLGPGFSVGAFQKKGQGIAADGSRVDENVFRVFPFGLDAVARVDFLSRRYGVPLVPFGKIGLDSYLWSNRKNGDLVKFPNGNDVRGSTLGFSGSAGLAFDLNVLDPNSAVNFDHSAGVNHSYVFGEVEFAQINDFGATNSFDFSTTLLNFGLALEF